MGCNHGCAATPSSGESLNIFLPELTVIACATNLTGPDKLTQRAITLQLMACLCQLKRWIPPHGMNPEEQIKDPLIKWWFNKGLPFLPALSVLFKTAQTPNDELSCAYVEELIKKHPGQYTAEPPPISVPIMQFYRCFLTRHNLWYRYIWGVAPLKDDQIYPDEILQVGSV